MWVLARLVSMLVFIVCIAVANVSSIISLACIMFLEGLLYSKTLSTFPTVCYILSQISSDCEFLDVDYSLPILTNVTQKSLNPWPVNSPPPPCTM